MKRQGRLIVPWNAPDPKVIDSYGGNIAPLCVEAISRARGRTLGLFASKARLETVAALVRDKLGDQYHVMVQGEAPRGHLIDRFREDVSSVLLGTKSFWAGVDVQGESLSCVLIDRIPFASQDDPILAWMEEQAKQAKERGERARSVFGTWSLPRAVIELRQGVGRLIRSTSDRGVVVVFDRRLTDSKYGASIVDALGFGEAFTTLDDIDTFLGGKS
jgi:ATP-dependent DNA helicase DinG